jgi:hypothetical protein
MTEEGAQSECDSERQSIGRVNPIAQVTHFYALIPHFATV